MPLTKLRFFAACAMLPGRLDELAALPDAFEAQRMHLALQPDAKHLISVKELKSSDKMSVASAQRWLSCDASDALARHAQLCTEPELKSDLENASRVALAWGAWSATSSIS
mmetsp:Transcript_8616/g.22410  ORF Transcript_8616/g.22410 Transcript_8616/m.22410 type:complete len:111 (+) Transcript_8616:1337-1669(+)